MTRTRTFQVVSNRIRHICSKCEHKRAFAVPPAARTRSIRCHVCGTRERINLNRRSQPREAQAGRVTLKTLQGKEILTDLFDISTKGVGTIVPYAFARALNVKEIVHFTCSWNQKLLTGNYEIRSIQGNKVGFKSLKIR